MGKRHESAERNRLGRWAVADMVAAFELNGLGWGRVAGYAGQPLAVEQLLSECVRTQRLLETPKCPAFWPPKVGI